MSNFAVPGENRGQKSRHLNGGASLLESRAPIESDDRQHGCWSREQLETMNDRFVAAVERAIAQGLERSLHRSDLLCSKSNKLFVTKETSSAGAFL